MNCINFTPEASHVMTASSDGSIAMVRCGNWALEKHWKSPHKGNPVNALAIHPSGKLALSAGGDGVLRTWNLVKGRQAFATNLVPRLKYDAKNVTILRWSPKGDKYLLATNCRVNVYSVEVAGLCAEMSFDSKVVCAEYIEDNLLAIGHEDGQVRVYDVAAGLSTMDVKAHDARVKCLAYRNNYLVSGSSTGEIKLWRHGKKKLNILTSASCDARITCMSLAQICPDLSVNKEQSEVAEKSEIMKPNVFRMRQEVTVKYEDEEDVASSRKEKKKSVKKRPAPETQEDVATNLSTKKLKKKKSAILPTNGTESMKKKKRSLSPAKSDVSPVKKPKRRVKKTHDHEIDETNIKDPGDGAIENKKKKKKRPITSIEKPTKPDIKKRKTPNEISSSISAFPARAKKKKISR